MDPKYANAFFGMASVYKSWKQYENSLKNYDKFVELSPDYADGNKYKIGIYNRGDIKFCLKSRRGEVDSSNSHNLCQYTTYSFFISTSLRTVLATPLPYQC